MAAACFWTLTTCRLWRISLRRWVKTWKLWWWLPRPTSWPASGVWVKLWRPTCKRLKPWWWPCPNSVFQMPCSLKPFIRWWIWMIWPPMALENPKFEMPWGAWEARKPWGSRSGSNQLTFWKSSKNSLGSPCRDVNQLQVFRGPLAPAPVWFWPTMMIWRHWQQHMSCEFGCFLTCCRNEFVDLLWLLQMNQSTSRVRCRITNSWSLCAPKTAWKLCPWFVGSQNATTLHHFVISFQSLQMKNFMFPVRPLIFAGWRKVQMSQKSCLNCLKDSEGNCINCLNSGSASYLAGKTECCSNRLALFGQSGELNLKRLDSSQSCQIWRASDPYCRDNIRLWRDHHPSWKPDYEFIHLISPYENMSNMFNMFILNSFLHLERSKTLCFLFSFAVLAPTLIRPASAALLSSLDFGGEYSHRSTSTAVEQWSGSSGSWDSGRPRCVGGTRLLTLYGKTQQVFNLVRGWFICLHIYILSVFYLHPNGKLMGKLGMVFLLSSPLPSIIHLLSLPNWI